MKHQYTGKLQSPARLAIVFTILAVIFTPSLFANSVEDDSGTTWTATREYNPSSSGYDIKIVTDENPATVYWVTADSGGDKEPWIAIDSATDYPVVVWSKSALGGHRIRISWFNGTSFGSPQTVTSGGIGYGDIEPHMVLESDGDIHLVFFRNHASSAGEAFYMCYTGSWSSAESYSVSSDDVIGSCMIKLVDEALGELEAEYHHDQSAERDRCKGGDGYPWTSCQ